MNACQTTPYSKSFRKVRTQPEPAAALLAATQIKREQVVNLDGHLPSQ